MGAVEQSIDRHAEEVSRLDDIEECVEKLWQDQRESLADSLAKGATLRVSSRSLLSGEDVCEHLFSTNPDEANNAMILSVNNPRLGGKHMDRLMREAALSLVDDFADGFKTEIEKDIEKGDAA